MFRGGLVIGLLVAAGIAVVAAAGTVLWLRRRLLVVTVQGASMLPTYQDGDRLLARRRPGQGVRVGEVVVADVPLRASELIAVPTPVGVDRDAFLGSLNPPGGRIIKRVAAAAGDPVPAGVHSEGPLVPPGQVVLLGDNPEASLDARNFGCKPVATVVGVVLRPLG